MSLRVFRFRRFSIRILAFVLGLLFAALAVTWRLVSDATLRSAMEHSESELELGGRIFDEATRQRIEFLAASANLMTSDYAFKSVILEGGDVETLSDALRNYTGRIGAPVVALFKPDGGLVANSDPAMANENVGPFGHLIRTATRENMEQASGFSYLNGRLHILVVVPFYAPYPNISAWFGLAFPIDAPFAQKIKATTRVEVTFVSTGEAEGPRVLATTLSESNARLVAHAVMEDGTLQPRLRTLTLPDDRYVTLRKFQEMLGEDPVAILLQRPLGPELRAARELQNYLRLVSVLALAVATLVALWIARGVSQPVLQLAEHTRHIASGDYARRIELHRVDELGQLANAFNEMSAGLAERDLVRDLLDKNVSPEVAAQLMRDGAALGGEEREVTILFADLRGFTTLSEKLAPHDLLALLNRYLDRMSAEIEREGGVIDKFIGDAIMALFGVPVAQGDAADRALAAALAMERALAGLNAELAAEGRPPLELGIGINTARVVAGNIGSHRRLNYSVIGDGVNVAARLQSLTRTPEYRTSIITSAATLSAVRGEKNFSPRALGVVQVKGRAEPVEIFAVDPA